MLPRKDIDLRSLTISDNYRRFGLSSNPFPVTGIVAEGPDFAPLDEVVTKEIISFIASTYTQQFFAGLLVVGDYGFGKTHIFKHLQRRINESLLMRGDERACAIYIMNPKSSAEEFMLSILESFGMHRFLVMVWRLVTEKLSNDLRTKGEKFADSFFPRAVQLSFFDSESPSSPLKEDLLSNPMKFIDAVYERGVDLRKLERYAEEVFRPIFKVPEIARNLSALSQYHGAEAFKNWAAALNYRAFSKALKKEIGEPEFFHAILTVFRRNGYRHVYILVDEFEDIFLVLGKRERVQYLSRLRDIIEHNLNYFSMALCVKHSEWQNIVGDSPAFAERFSRRVELKSLTVENMASLIADYLGKVAMEGERDINNPYHPFTPDAIKEIQRKSLAVPRAALEICFVLLEHAAKHDVNIIDSEMVRQVQSIRESLLIEKRPII